jgi:3-hydroxypropanoate dehydrogenase
LWLVSIYSTTHPAQAMNISTEQLFNNARTAIGYLPTPVSDAELLALYDLLKWGPTSANCSPARLAFVRSAAGKEQLLACVGAGNVNKVRAAPVTVVVGMDMAFYERLPQLFPHTDAKAWFTGNAKLAQDTAFRNSSLQGGYLIMAARALGLDCGPMSGFDAHKMDATFWAGTSVHTNFICTLGHADTSLTRPRGPRLAFDEACRLC